MMALLSEWDGAFPLSVRMILFAGVQLSVKNTTHEWIVADLAERRGGAGGARVGKVSARYICGSATDPRH